MAERILPLTCVIPANTTVATPAVFPLVFPSADVERIDVRIPPGPSGQVGFFVGNGGGSYIPDTLGTWIIGDNDYITWPTTNAPNNGNWNVTAYNTDLVPHTLYVYFLVSNIAISRIPSSGKLVGL